VKNHHPEILAVIPARGNSKTIPRKNIREFAGFPLIAYSIAAAKQSRSVTRILVSTDDGAIAAVARDFGGETPFMRPDEISQDDTLDLPVFIHALEWLSANENYQPDFVIQLRPTSPIRPQGLIDQAVDVMIKHPQADSVRGVVTCGQNPFKMWKLDESGRMLPILELDGIPEAYNAPRQNLPPVYWQTGHIDVIRTATILEKKSMSGDVVFPVMIDPKYTVDIDTLLDWERAERLVVEGGLEMVHPGHHNRPFPTQVTHLFLDFDGVMTDDRVWVDQDGRECVAASRSDGLGLEILRHKTQIRVMVISKETNPVVAARCKKLDLEVVQDVSDKAEILQAFIDQNGISPQGVIYMGNDINDLPCFLVAGYAVVPSNAVLACKQQADLILGSAGGFGAVRELCDLLVNRLTQ